MFFVFFVLLGFSAFLLLSHYVLFIFFFLFLSLFLFLCLLLFLLCIIMHFLPVRLLHQISDIAQVVSRMCGSLMNQHSIQLVLGYRITCISLYLIKKMSEIVFQIKRKKASQFDPIKFLIIECKSCQSEYEHIRQHFQFCT